VENLRLLPSGSRPPNPAELLGSRRLGTLTEDLCEEAQIVILDAPPILAVTDAAVLSRNVEGVLVVIEAGRTREREACRALEELNKVDAPILGVVLNKVPIGRENELYGVYYHRRYRYGESGDEMVSRAPLREKGFLLALFSWVRGFYRRVARLAKLVRHPATD
jgi:capsular exopolysaccharide synthesis family protein